MRAKSEALADWQRPLDAGYHPHRLAFAIPNDAALPGLLAERTPRDTPVAYVCTGMTCRAPITSPGEL